MKRFAQRLIRILLFIFLLTMISCGGDARSGLIHVSPESEGFSSLKLVKVKEHIEKSGSSALMILIDGNVIFEWGESRKKHTVHSIRKALLNSLYGIAIERGQIDTSATLRALNINDIEPELTENELNARIADLLKSRSGVYHNAAAVSKGMLQGMPDFKGKYASIDGESDDAEIPNTDGFYQFERSKSKFPAYHFRMSARDLALYGQLYLNKGNWKGEQILSEEWIETSTKPYSEYNAEYGIGYGMLWYVREDSFYHTGLGVHMLAIYPDSNMVLVHRVDTENNFDYNNQDLYKMIGLIFDSKN